MGRSEGHLPNRPEDAMAKYFTRGLLSTICLLGWSSAADAHFNLMEPKPAQTEGSTNGGKGGPPCPRGTASNVITPVEGGKPLAIRINEFVPHPGHYRIALAATLEELPKDPEVMKKPNGDSMSATIDPAPKLPVLKDGALVHTGRLNGVQTIMVDIPNIDCPKCTLQVVEFMADHSPPFFYWQCATLKITASGAADAGAPDAAPDTGSPGTGGMSSSGTGGSVVTGTGGSTAGTGGTTTGTGGTVAGTGGMSSTGTGGSTGRGGSGAGGSTQPQGGGEESKGGLCSFGGDAPSAAGWLGLALLAGLAVRTRRRR